MAKDKARLRGSLLSIGRQDSDSESVASSTRERVVGRREMRVNFSLINSIQYRKEVLDEYNYSLN